MGVSITSKEDGKVKVDIYEKGNQIKTILKDEVISKGETKNLNIIKDDLNLDKYNIDAINIVISVQ